MKTFQFERRIELPAPLPRVFEFFADPRNLDRLTPPWLHFEFLTQDRKPMAVGRLLNYRLRLHGIPIRWQSEITVWEPPHSFVDRQTRGPYRLWVHTHNFLARGNHTLVEDLVQYAVPGGALIGRLFVAPDLKRIFAYRHEVLEKTFGAAGGTAAV